MNRLCTLNKLRLYLNENTQAWCLLRLSRVNIHKSFLKSLWVLPLINLILTFFQYKKSK